MSARATTLAYVRTDAGVVQVDAGDLVPAGALDEHVLALTESGVLELVDDPGQATVGLVDVPPSVSTQAAPASVETPPARGRSTRRTAAADEDGDK